MEGTKIEFSMNFLLQLLSLPETSTWSKNISVPMVYMPVTSGSFEFIAINDLFIKNWKRRNCVWKIEGVENPYLLGSYLLKKQKSLQRCLPDKRYFHCTQRSKLDQICKFNFNWRLKGTARGHKFGQGVSFTPDSHYASHYGEVMILAKVLKSLTLIGDTCTVVPPAPYDTTTNGKDSVYVKYEDDDFYPEYIIHY